MIKQLVRYEIRTNVELFDYEHIFLNIEDPEGIKYSIKPKILRKNDVLSCDVTDLVYTKLGSWMFQFLGENDIINKNIVYGSICEFKNPHTDKKRYFSKGD